MEIALLVGYVLGFEIACPLVFSFGVTKALGLLLKISIYSIKG